MDCPVPSYNLEYLVCQRDLGFLMDPKDPNPMVLAKLNLSSAVTRCYTRPPHTYRHLVRVDPPEVTTETRCFDIWHLTHRDGAFEIISSSLSVLGIPPEFHSPIADHLCEYGQRAATNDSNAGRRSVPLEVVIEMHEFHPLIDDDEEEVEEEEESLERALAESEAAAGHGMVPASAAAVKKMLKRVRVHEDGEIKKKRARRRSRNIDEVAMVSCAVCLEDIPAGSMAAKMPCSHVFHSKCIVRWLRESHFCPTCRFELPTATAS